MANDEEKVDDKKSEKDPEQEEDINKEDEREQMTDDAEISPREGGFVEGDAICASILSALHPVSTR